MSSDQEGSRQVIGYLALRTCVGVLGIALPVVLVVVGLADGDGLQPTISDYYHTAARDLFVGLLFAIGLFLFSYKGPAGADDAWGYCACALALGVAVFPNDSSVRALHFACAAGLFLVLSWFSLGLFTRGSASPTPQKTARNRVYVTCGVVMIACIALIAVIAVLPGDGWAASWRPVLWLESVALWAFGLSWLTKAEVLRVLWADPPPRAESARLPARRD